MTLTLKDIKPLLKEEWYLEHSDAKPFFISPHVKAFVRGLHPASYSLVLCYYRDGEMDWMTLRRDQKRLFRAVVNKQMADDRYWQKIFKKWVKDEKKFRKFYDELIEKDVRPVSEPELLADMRQYYEYVDQSRRRSSIIDSFIFVADTEFKRIIDEFMKQSETDIKAVEVYSVLTAPVNPSFFSTCEMELANLTKNILRKTKKIDYQVLIANQQVKKHIKRYYWIKRNSFIDGGRDYDLDDVAKEMKKIIKQGSDKVIRKNKEYLRNRARIKKYIRQYKFNKEIKTLSVLIGLFGKWQDLRKENSLMVSHLSNKYLEEIASRKKVKKDIIAYLDYSETGDLFNKKINLAAVERRRRGSLFVFKGESLAISCDEQILDLVIDKIINKKTASDEIKGTIASPGLARGGAVIVRSIKSLKRVKRGNILIATMTRPEHMMAIRKAAAIVTDDGGITCHAAIVSRELGIPCIIGTKIATRVLKDGDLVEVDATKGIVRKFKS